MKRVLVVSAIVCGLAASLPADGRKFFDDDPVSAVKDTQDASRVRPWDISLTYDSLINLFGVPDNPPSVRAQDVNTIDEVPDSSWFSNRKVSTPEEIIRGVDDDKGPAPGKWTVRSGKGNGVSPGFTITDTRGRRYFVKFDPPGWNELATGAEVVVTRLYYALGYYVPQTNIAYLRREDLELGEGATTTAANGSKRRMRNEDIASNLSRAARLPDGRYRTLVSEALPGEPLGGFKYVGTRPDDPNDVVPHEHRRSLRALRVFGAWVNHVDAKAINSLDTLIKEQGRSAVRHNLLDFGSTLGSAGIGPRDRRDGHEYVLETGPMWAALPTFGFLPRPWMSIDYPEYRRLGRFEAAAFVPEDWKPRFPNTAFNYARADDLFWGARRLKALLTDDLIRAAVKAGQYSDPKTEEALAGILIERRDKIAKAWLTPINPIVDVALSDGALTFRNAAVEHGVAQAPPSYLAVWSRFDNATGTATRITETRGGERMTAPSGLPSRAGDYLQLDLSAVEPSIKAWAVPVHAWFRRNADGWKLVGFERLP
jgi:hypothetical protein